jgi:hypothetical protein
MARKLPPDWADHIDQEALNELGREDRQMREIEAGETPPVVQIEQPWSTTGEVAARHACKPETIREHIASGRLKARVLNPDVPLKQRRYRIKREWELEWSEAQAAARAPSSRRPSTVKPQRAFRERVQK